MMNVVLQVLFAFAVSTISLFPSAEALACGVCRDCLEGKVHPPGYRHPKDVKTPAEKEAMKQAAQASSERKPASVEKPAVQSN